MNHLVFNEVSNRANYLPDVKIQPDIHPTAAIRNSQLLGNVIVSENVHIVNAVLRADEGTPFFVGAGSNIQDFAVLHGYVTQEKNAPISDNLIFVEGKGYYSIYIGEKVTVAHGALIHGPAAIGNNTFVGFKATVDAASIGANVEIGAHSYIKKVVIPDNVAIMPNAVITKQEDVSKYVTSTVGINTRIVDVNLEMAQAYRG